MQHGNRGSSKYVCFHTHVTWQQRAIQIRMFSYTCNTVIEIHPNTYASVQSGKREGEFSHVFICVLLLYDCLLQQHWKFFCRRWKCFIVSTIVFWISNLHEFWYSERPTGMLEALSFLVYYFMSPLRDSELGPNRIRRRWNGMIQYVSMLRKQRKRGQYIPNYLQTIWKVPRGHVLKYSRYWSNIYA